MSEREKFQLSIDLDNLSDSDGEGDNYVRPVIPKPVDAPLPTEFPVLQSLPAHRTKLLVDGTSAHAYALKWLQQRNNIIPQRLVRRDIPGVVFSDGEVGYIDATEMCADFDRVVNFLWYIATPELQLNYGMDFAKLFSHMVKQMEAAPVATFIVLRKFDDLFAALMIQKDPVTGTDLPDSNQPSLINMTYVVRLQSLIDRVKADIIARMRNLAGWDAESSDDESLIGDDEDDEDDNDEDLGPSFTKSGNLRDPDDPGDEPLRGVKAEDGNVEVDGSGWRPPVTTLELGVHLGEMFEQTLVALDFRRVPENFMKRTQEEDVRMCDAETK